MILFDHVIGDPVSHFTYRVLGYSDAAEIFVFVSGLTCGIVYFQLFSKSGWPSLLRAVVGRASRIYIYYALSSIAIVFLVAISRADIDTTLSALARDPVNASGLILGLVYSPPVSGILLLYLPLTLIVMPLFFWGVRRNAVAALCISGLVWIISQLYPQFGAVLTERAWFNPLAWQFLFVIGLFFGVRYHASGEKPLFKGIEWFVAAAWIVVCFSFLYRSSLFISSHTGFDLEWLRIPGPTLVYMKETLSPVRAVHFLSMALLFATYVRPNSSILQSFFGKSFIIAGQRSLEMFTVSAVLSMATNAYVVVENPSMPVRLILDCAMVSMMALTALIINRSDRRRSALISTDSQLSAIGPYASDRMVVGRQPKESSPISPLTNQNQYGRFHRTDPRNTNPRFVDLAALDSDHRASDKMRSVNAWCSAAAGALLLVLMMLLVLGSDKNTSSTIVGTNYPVASKSTGQAQW